MCQFVPAPGINGYSLDLMRRDPGDHPNGLLDFALCSTIEHLQAGGYEGLSLNFATLRSTLSGDKGDGTVQRAERWFLKRLSNFAQIESLWRFNAKYEPEWLPRYVVFDTAEHLVPVVMAILRAESVWEIPVLGRLLAAGRRSGCWPRSERPRSSSPRHSVLWAETVIPTASDPAIGTARRRNPPASKPRSTEGLRWRRDGGIRRPESRRCPGEHAFGDQGKRGWEGVHWRSTGPSSTIRACCQRWERLSSRRSTGVATPMRTPPMLWEFPLRTSSRGPATGRCR